MKTLKIIDFLGNNTSKRELHPAGYLRLPDSIIARSGVLRYDGVICEDGTIVNDGAVITVYRPPAALRECVQYFNNLPLTKKHPEENAVDPTMVRGVQVGSLGSNARALDGAELRKLLLKQGRDVNGIDDKETYIIADIMVHDKDAIDEVQAGNFEQLSAGYETAYRQKRGVTPSGQAYEAEQFYLMPNHTALVENGRCGSECRVCDHEDIKSQKENKMKRLTNSAKGIFRYFLAKNDSGDDVTEIDEEVFNQLKDEPGTEVEEMDEDEVVIEENKVPGVETEELDEEGVCETCGKSNEECNCPPVKTDEELAAEAKAEGEPEQKEIEEQKTDDGDIFEVQLDDGTIGKMDQSAYDYFSRYMEVQKKGDSMEQNTGMIMKLSATASRVLGESYAVDSYINKDGKFDARGLKLAVIGKVMPNIVTRTLKNDEAIDNLFNTAVETSKKNKTDWKADMANLVSAKSPLVTDAKVTSPVATARQNRLNIINKRDK
jgi:hypothetical protein